MLNNGTINKSDCVQTKTNVISINYHSLDKNSEFSDRQVWYNENFYEISLPCL